jgi:RNA polymerase-binding transcription factor DksA
MSQTDVDYMERRLLEERERALDDLRQATEEESEGQRESAGELSRMPTHMADAASDTQEAEKDLANASRESNQLALIDTALRILREDPDAYTTCERCGAEIEAERLDVVPWARVCAGCAREREEEAGAAPD